MSQLAIIIPAYKDTYLNETLQSLVRQTDPDFTVYVGDDCSPHDLQSIVRPYASRLHIVYHRFAQNLGGTDLVAHWERCLQLMDREEFFCLFSDDDVLQPTCVERLRQTWQSCLPADVYHFDLDIIGADSRLLRHCPAFAPLLPADDFIRLLYTYQIDARMPEFVFRTEAFRQAGGFVRFDLAYRADNAVVLAVARNRGIRTVPEARVCWRDSGANVSSSTDSALHLRRVMASIDFFNWLEARYAHWHTPCPLSVETRRRQLLAELDALAGQVAWPVLRAALWRIGLLRRNPYLYVRSLLHLHKKYTRQKRRQ